MSDLFNGCVQVSPEKLKIALDDFKKGKDAIDYIIKSKISYVVNELHPKLTKFKRWWYLPEKYYLSGRDIKFYTAAKANGGRGRNMFSYKEQNLVDLKLITETEYRLWEYFSGRYGYEGVYSELKAMLDCGEPIYVTPTQAKFINNHYNKVNK